MQPDKQNKPPVKHSKPAASRRPRAAGDSAAAPGPPTTPGTTRGAAAAGAAAVGGAATRRRRAAGAALAMRASQRCPSGARLLGCPEQAGEATRARSTVLRPGGIWRRRPAGGGVTRGVGMPGQALALRSEYSMCQLRIARQTSCKRTPCASLPRRDWAGDDPGDELAGEAPRGDEVGGDPVPGDCVLGLCAAAATAADRDAKGKASAPWLFAPSSLLRFRL